ncbi:electron transfer flavoprotein subunit beta/FixA family protein [Micrococcus lylae]|uniref:Electron transfer flavoprotein subunit beta n=1 Tax=Micrococcus lylae TaxID=1273 RepID=A0ABY2JZQ5_9MICC|nr:electron transfer flavoprotein subunit beta/FixA family protein [Micrococcus lylae]TFH98713.1 electron transfer flavoprotein subunit beta/FixA family protein [Micrococcus lylae]
MKFLVLVKHVPSTDEPRHLSGETGLLDRDSIDFVAEELTERALEAAVQAKGEDASAEIVVLTVAPEAAEKTMRHMLALGADRAVHVCDESLAGSDMLQTARVIAAAVEKESPDVVLGGTWSTDGRGGMVPAMVAELLGLPVLPDLDSLTVADGTASGTCRTGEQDLTLEAPLPVVVFVTERVAEPRFPNFKGIMAAKKKPLERLSTEDLGLKAGPAHAPVRSVMVSASEAPAKEAGTVIVDDGQAAAKIVEFIEARRHA